MVSNIFYFTPIYFGKQIPSWIMFQLGWNHQLVTYLGKIIYLLEIWRVYKFSGGWLLWVETLPISEDRVLRGPVENRDQHLELTKFGPTFWFISGIIWNLMTWFVSRLIICNVRQLWNCWWIMITGTKHLVLVELQDLPMRKGTTRCHRWCFSCSDLEYSFEQIRSDYCNQ